VDNEKGLLEDEPSEEGGKTAEGGFINLRFWVLGFGVWGEILFWEDAKKVRDWEPSPKAFYL